MTEINTGNWKWLFLALSVWPTRIFWPLFSTRRTFIFFFIASRFVGCHSYRAVNANNSVLFWGMSLSHCLLLVRCRTSTRAASWPFAFVLFFPVLFTFSSSEYALISIPLFFFSSFCLRVFVLVHILWSIVLTRS